MIYKTQLRKGAHLGLIICSLDLLQNFYDLYAQKFNCSAQLMKTLVNTFKQPLIQFLLLGALIFAIDRAVIGNEEDLRSILIDDAKYAEIAGIFQDNQDRTPNAQEMSALTIKWAQNEVLYREARMMGLDKGDEMIRQRLILKLRNVLFNHW